jgi:stage V sporulation protein B
MSDVSPDSLLPGAVAPPVRDFFRDVTATALTRVAGVATGVVTLTLTTRLLGPEGRGEFAVAMACLGMVLQFCHLGLHSAATYHLARFPQQRRAVTGLLATFAFGGVGLVSLAGVWLVHAMPGLVPHVSPTLVALALSTAPAAMFVMLAGSAWLGLGHPARYNGLDLATKAIGLGAVTLLVWWTVPVLFVAYAVAHYVVAVCAYVSLVGWTRPTLDAGLWRSVLQYGSRMFLVNVFMYLVLRQDLFLVNAWLGSAQAGHYSVAVQVSELLSLATASVTAMLFPKLVGMSPAARRAAVGRALRWMAAGLAIAALGLAVTGRPLFDLAFGPMFAASLTPFWLLLPGLWCLGMNSVLLQYLAAGGMPWFVIASTAAAVIVNLVCNALLIPRFGIGGAATASSLTYAMLLVASVAYLRVCDRRRDFSSMDPHATNT